jgi:DNA processing protein
MVGSRNPTPAGCDIATRFACRFSKIGLTVTSGLAIGIDAAAHKGALLGKGGTIAVLGHGLDRIYPPLHQRLAEEILNAGGTLVSEFSIGVPPLPFHFPRRNRVISGLTLGTLVVEAALKSGSLITAKLALDQGREVFAILGSIHNPLAKGCHALIREGAKLVETAEDVLEELQGFINYDGYLKKEGEPGLENAQLENHYQMLLTQIGYECTTVDSVIAKSGLTAKKVLCMLLELELKGYVKSIPGGYARLMV